MSRQSTGDLENRLTKKIFEFPGKTFIRSKLNNWLGYLFVSCIACVFAWLFARDMLFGIGLFGILVGFFVVILCLTNVEFGFYLLLFLGFFGYYFSSALFQGNLPVGLSFDCLVLVNFLGLMMSRKDFKQNWKQFTRIPLVLFMWLAFFYSLVEMFNPNTMGASASNLLGVRKF